MKAQKNHQYILEQAYKVFIKKGYSQVTMTDIITECGISRGGVYRYLRSTKDIFIALVRQKLFELPDMNL
ncbi:TetR/AcrR family transcriptional regulator [Xenorhabdus siamensis]|uniref:TetR/AcrR family transcriptional regulator n=1 Tax=Xenorhabdus siamensis TaxID=3136254 RepID=UPI0030F3F3AF